MKLNDRQISLIRTIWELAQGRIDSLYAPESAEQEKHAVEEWMKEAFPDYYDEWVRADCARNKVGGNGMQAGRELDAKVAEALGWHKDGDWWYDRGGVYRRDDEKHFSTSWDGMGVLVDEAYKQGYTLTLNHVTPKSIGFRDEDAQLGDFHCCIARYKDAEAEIDEVRVHAHGDTAPLAVALAFIEASELVRR